MTGGAAPYLDLPATAANDRSARGYGEGRYRGDHLVYGEVEYRGALTKGGLLGFVAFLNTTTIGSQETGERAVRLVCARRRDGIARAVEQAVQDQPVHRLRLGQTGLARILPGHPGSVLDNVLRVPAPAGAWYAAPAVPCAIVPLNSQHLPRRARNGTWRDGGSGLVEASSRPRQGD